MSLRFPMILPAWQYADPATFVDVRMTAPAPVAATVLCQVLHQPRDRYYTQARRLHVKQLMRGRP